MNNRKGLFIMAKQITDELKNLFAAQGVTATGETIAEVLKSGYEQLNDATVSGNQIADVISQTAETGTFPSGGGAAPTVVTEITWDGDTTGLESHTAPIGEGGTTITLYKVSDSVLPYAIFDGQNGYVYSGTDQSDETFTDPKVSAFDGYVTLGEGFPVVSAYFDNFESAIFGGVIVPTAGTWIKKDGTSYIKSVTVTEA